MMLQRCVFKQEYAAAKIRGRINERLDKLMEHEASVWEEWSRNGAIRCREGERICWIDDGTGTGYRDAGNFVYACALECALLGAPARNNSWHSHDYGQEKTGDMLEIILSFAWQDGDHRLHRWWRDAVEDLARKTEALIGAMQFHEQMHPRAIQFHEKMHHTAFAMLVRKMWERFAMHTDLS